MQETPPIDRSRAPALGLSAAIHGAVLGALLLLDPAPPSPGAGAAPSLTVELISEGAQAGERAVGDFGQLSEATTEADRTASATSAAMVAPAETPEAPRPDTETSAPAPVASATSVASTEPIASTTPVSRPATKNAAKSTTVDTRPQPPRSAIAPPAPAATGGGGARMDGETGQAPAGESSGSASRTADAPVLAGAGAWAVVRRIDPDYPLLARRQQREGEVLLRAEISADGRPGQILVQRSSGHEVLDSAAARAVKDWRFRVAAPLTVVIPIVFRLDRARSAGL